MEDTLWKNASHLVIERTKSFSPIEINNKLQPTPSMSKREGAAFLRMSTDRRDVGHVQIAQSSHSNWIHGRNVSVLPVILVDKNAPTRLLKKLSISLVLCLVTSCTLVKMIHTYWWMGRISDDLVVMENGKIFTVWISSRCWIHRLCE